MNKRLKDVEKEDMQYKIIRGNDGKDTKLATNNNYVYIKTNEGTRKVYFNEDDYISSIKNKPPKYIIKMNNKVIQD